VPAILLMATEATMALQLQAGPDTEPISLEEAKAHIKPQDSAAENDLIKALITAMREAAEHALDRSLITQTWRLTLDAFPCDGVILLEKPPILTVESVKYWNVDGVQITLAGAAYALDKESEPGRLVAAPGTAWPGTQLRMNAVEVIYTAGYGAEAADVPSAVKQWMLAMMRAAYDNPAAFAQGALPQLGYVDGLLDRCRVPQL
jgi:uncharacterized phiE125 gp8 family phage protein